MDFAEREQVRYFAAKTGGKLCAYMEVSDEGESFVASGNLYRHITGAYCIPEHRGKGVYQNLLNYVIDTLKTEGYTRLGVDFESINPSGSGFWLKYFHAYTNVPYAREIELRPYLDGEPEAESIARVGSAFRSRPLVCLTKAWEVQIQARYPDAVIYRRTAMKPSCRFTMPTMIEIPEGYLLTGMDEAAFEQHPFSHGENYSYWPAFQSEGSGAVVYYGGEIVAAASSFLSMNSEVELDVSTKEAHQGKNLATACIARMLQDCMKRGITVHWDAQNDVSRHLADKFGFEAETEYPVYWIL